MIDIVYPLSKASKWQNNEVRYSLRAVEKHLSGFGKVWVVGDKPSFLQNVNHISVLDGKDPAINIMKKVYWACQNDVSEDFLFFNDDHFLLADFEASTFPYYFNSHLQTYIQTRGADMYARIATNTINFLQERGLPTRFYDIHYPFLINKTKFLEMHSQLEPKRDGYIMKSLYANYIKADGVEIKDCKSRFIPVNLKCFSTHPVVLEGVQNWLQKTFLKKSIYEG